MSKNLKGLNVGLDVSSKTFVAELLDDEGKKVTRRRQMPNTPSGATALEELLGHLGQSYGYQRIRIGLEATNFYEFHLAEHLANSTMLAALAHVEIYRINPKRIKNFKRSYPDMDKTDAVDAFIIADFLRFGRLPFPYQSEKSIWPLKRLTRYRFHLVKTVVREINYFLCHLFLKCSGIAQQKPVSPMSATNQMLVETFPSIDELIDKPIEELAVLLAKASKNHQANTKAVAEKVHWAAVESYRLRPELAKSVNFILIAGLRNIRAYKDCIKQVDQAILEEGKVFLNPLITIHGFGPVYSYGIFAETMPVERFLKKEDSLAKMAGLWWRRHQTAEFEAEERRLPSGCNKYLRYYLVEAASALRVHNAEYKAYYAKKYREVTKHQHKRALVLTARKLVRLVYSLLKSNRNYTLEYEPPVRLPKQDKTATAPNIQLLAA